MYVCILAITDGSTSGLSFSKLLEPPVRLGYKTEALLLFGTVR